MRRVFATASAVFERFVDRVENHEGVADALIRDVARGAARLRAQAAGLDREVERLQAGHDAAASDAAAWRRRAASEAATDEACALACVQRMQAAATRAAELQSQMARAQELRARMASDLSDVEMRLQSLRQRRLSLSARSARAQAMAVDGEEGALAAVFERWEATIAGDESMTAPSPLEADPLAQRFERQERDLDLRAALADIVAEGAQQ